MANRLSLARKRLLRSGPEGLGDAELLGLWLGIADPVCVDSALTALGGVSRLGQRSAERLRHPLGLGDARVARLIAAIALLDRRRLAELEAGPVLSCSASVRRFLTERLGGARREIFAALFLDSRHRLIRFEVLFLGTVDRAQVHPREVLRRALELNAAALILAHNHPSGVAEPSASDLALTQDLVDLLGRVDVRVLDHVVVGHGAEVSFAERGLI